MKTALLEHSSIREAVVIPYETNAQYKQLAAYMVVDGHTPDTSEVRHFLSRSLPDYMIPAVFTVLDALPLTAHGKLDRRALPVPDFTAAMASPFVAPRTTLEYDLVALWETLLNVSLIGIHHSFFEVGGNSLLANQLVLRIRQQFGVVLPVRAVFETPTVAGLAGQISRQTTDTQPAFPINHVPDAVQTLSLAQERLWFLEQLEPGSATYNLPIAVRLSGTLNLAGLVYSINVIQERHESSTDCHSVRGWASHSTNISGGSG